MNQVILKSEDSKSIKPLIISALHAEENEIKTGILKTKEKLTAFEKRYSMSTEEFIKSSNKPLPFSELEAIEWSGEYETLKRLEAELSRILNIVICT